MRTVAILLAAGLAACSAAGTRQPTEQDVSAALSNCWTITQHQSRVVYQSCKNRVWANYRRAIGMPFASIYERQAAENLVIARQEDAGRITPAAAALAYDATYDQAHNELGYIMAMPSGLMLPPLSDEPTPGPWQSSVEPFYQTGPSSMPVQTFCQRVGAQVMCNTQ